MYPIFRKRLSRLGIHIVPTQKTDAIVNGGASQWVSAIAGVFGSLVGGSATVATAWITQKTLNKRELIGAEIRARENALRRVHSQMLQASRGLVYAYNGQAGAVIAHI